MSKQRWFTPEKKYDVSIIMLGSFIGMLTQIPGLNNNSTLSLVFSAFGILGTALILVRWVNNREKIIEELTR